MLNSYNIKHESKVVAVTQVVEKTITPDKVTEMYDKVREQVEKDILRTVLVDDNILKGVVVEMRDDLNSFQRKVLFRYTLNGKEHIRTEFTKDANISDEKLIGMLHDYIKDSLAVEIIKENLKVFIKK